jgi:hypothetical protein
LTIADQYIILATASVEGPTEVGRGHLKSFAVRR